MHWCEVGQLCRLLPASNLACMCNADAPSQHRLKHTDVHLQAYADYNDLMELTEQLISGMVKELKGSYKIQYHAKGPGQEPIEIDFTPPWPRLSMIAELEKELDVQIPKDLYAEETRQFLDDLCWKKEVECGKPRVRSSGTNHAVKHSNLLLRFVMWHSNACSRCMSLPPCDAASCLAMP